MATINELLNNPGPYITKLFPLVQQLRENNNPFQINEAAKILFDKQILWGESNLSYSKQSEYPVQNVNNTDFTQAETVLLKNFQFLINSLPMAANNSWLDFQKFVDLFYQILDPIGFFTTNADPAWYNDMCPYPHPCLNGMNFYTHRIGLYKRPMTAGEGTGFKFATTVNGAVGIEEEVKVFFNMAMSPFPCPPTGHCWDLAQLENHYFTLGTGGPTENDILVVWYNAGTGVQPVVVGPGAVAYLQVNITSFGTQEYLQSVTEAAIIGQGTWTVASNDPGNHVTLFKAAATGKRTNAADGRDGFATPNTTMRASDNTIIATNLVTDTAWQNAHNDLRVPYEKQAFDDDYMYIKSLNALSDNFANVNQCVPDGPLPINHPSCSTPGYFIMTPAVGIITEIPLNKAVLRDNRAGNKRKPVIG